jgi:hypothetical protein
VAEKQDSPCFSFVFKEGNKMEKITAFKTCDGKLFESEDTAIEHEATLQLRDALSSHVDKDLGCRNVDDVLDSLLRIIADNGWIFGGKKKEDKKKDHISELCLKDNCIVCACCGNLIEWVVHSIQESTGKEVIGYRCKPCGIDGHTLYIWEQLVDLPKTLPKY